MGFFGLEFKNNYNLTENEYSLENEANVSALFTVGNGYMGVRGSLEEYGSLCVQGSYIRGLIDEVLELPQPFLDNEYMKKHYFNEQELRRFQKQEKVINFADFLLVRITIGGETFFPWEGELLSWERNLDLDNGVLSRNVRWKNTNGQITKIYFERFASADNDHIFAQKVKITPENYSDKIEIITGVDGLTKTNGQLVTERISASSQNGVTYYENKSGNKFGFRIATVTANEMFENGKKFDCGWSNAIDEELIAVKGSFDAKEGKIYTLQKRIFVICSRESENPMADAKEFIKNIESYDDLHKKHIEKWHDYFNRMDVKIGGDDLADSALRFNNYHTFISFNRNDSVHSLGAKGLTGEVYNNWVWWDCEAYQSPVFFYTIGQSIKPLQCLVGIQ